MSKSDSSAKVCSNNIITVIIAKIAGIAGKTNQILMFKRMLLPL